jgi:hypothetical protein
MHAKQSKPADWRRRGGGAGGHGRDANDGRRRGHDHDTGNFTACIIVARIVATGKHASGNDSRQVSHCKLYEGLTESITMTWTRWLLGAGAALVLGAAALPAQAAPAAALATAGTPASAAEGGMVDKVHWRRGYHYGYGYGYPRHSYGYGPTYSYGDYYYPRRYYRYAPAYSYGYTYPRRHYGYGPAYSYGGYYPRRYRYRPAATFYGPGFGFYFGPRYRYGW